MSENAPSSSQGVPETNSPVFLAMRQVAQARSPEDLITAVRTHLVPNADRVSLFHLETEQSGKAMCRAIATWDAEKDAPEAELPEKVYKLIENQPLVVIDTIYLDEFLAPLKDYMVEALKAASFAIIPLLHGEQTIGYLEVVTRKTGLNQDEQVRALLLVCWHISATMETLLQEAELSASRVRFNATTALLRAIAGSGQAAALSEAVVKTVQQVLPLTHLSVALAQDEAAEVKTETWFGPELPKHATFSGSLIQQALMSGKAVMVDGLFTSAVEETQDARNEELQKLVVAPMMAGDKAVGALVFGFGKATKLTADDKLLCEEIAIHLAAAYTHLKAIDGLQKSLEETTTLYSTSLAMTAAQTIDEVYSTLLSEMGAVSSADRLILYLAGPDPREQVDYVEVAAVWRGGSMQASKGQLRYPLEQAPVLSQFPQSRSNLIFNDTKTDVRLDRDLRAFYAEERVNALMLIPLSTGAIWVGALLLEATNGQSFSNEQARLSRSLADQAALALDTQLLLLRRDKVIVREQALRLITDRIRESHSIEEILAITAEELGKVTGINSEKLKTVDMSDSVRIRMSREEREFVSSVQYQVSLAIDNLKLLQSTREAADNEQALRDIASALNSTLDLEEVLALILSSLSRVLPHDAANILLIAGGMARPISLRGYAEKGINEAALHDMRFPIDQTPNLKQMISTKSPYHIADTHTFEGWVSTKDTEWVRSYLGAPIYVEDEIIGFLNLDSATPNFYNPTHFDRLQAFANQAAIAIRNAQVYQATRLQAEVMGSVTASLQGAAGVDNVLETAVRSLSGALENYDIKLRLVPQSGLTTNRRMGQLDDPEQPASDQSTA